tara:strand:+ start:322 stop:759 length:438 start_codon:yes stop_codon:yes gene_type:complete
MHLFQLVYVSKISESFDVDKDIDNILQIANKRNKSLGITGMLIYRDGMFVQLLEGKKESVINIYGYIASDIRHDCIKTIYKNHIRDERIFEDWTMGLSRINRDMESFEEIDNLWNQIMKDLDQHKLVDNNTILEFMKKFRFSKKS